MPKHCANEHKAAKHIVQTRSSNVQLQCASESQAHCWTATGFEQKHWPYELIVRRPCQLTTDLRSVKSLTSAKIFTFRFTATCKTHGLIEQWCALAPVQYIASMLRSVNDELESGSGVSEESMQRKNSTTDLHSCCKAGIGKPRLALN